MRCNEERMHRPAKSEVLDLWKVRDSLDPSIRLPVTIWTHTRTASDSLDPRRMSHPVSFDVYIAKATIQQNLKHDSGSTRVDERER